MGYDDEQLLRFERAVARAIERSLPETWVEFVCGDSAIMRCLHAVPAVGDHVDVSDAEYNPPPHVRVTGIVRRRTWTTVSRGERIVLRVDVAPEEPAATDPR